MFLAIVNNYFHVIHWVARESAAFHSRFDTFFNWRQIRLREIHTNQFIGEFKVTVVIWLDAEVDFPKLTCATGLFLMAVLCTGFSGDAFAIRNPWLMCNQANLEFHLGAMDSDINVLVAHALQNSLMSDGIILPDEGHIFFTQTGKRR